MALKAETELTPEALRDHVKQIEAEVGRTPTYQWGPRVIDIDILLYGDTIVDIPNLVIPHPQTAQAPLSCSFRWPASPRRVIHPCWVIHPRAAAARRYPGIHAV